MLRRIPAAVITAALAFGCLLTGPADAGEPYAHAIRISGADRIDTAIRVALGYYPSEYSDVVVLARQDAFADAAAAGPLAAAAGGPLLLTPKDRLDPRVALEMQRVLDPEGAGLVYLMGGTAAISPAVEKAVRDLGYDVVRLAGVDRYETSVLVAEEIGDTDLLFLATGRNFPDALAAGAPASLYGGAILLTDGPVLPRSVREYLAKHAAEAEVYAVGGPAIAAYAVPKPYQLSGANRYETATMIAREFFEDPELVGLASGENFPDALVAGTGIGRYGGPLLLIQPNAVPQSLSKYLTEVRETVRDVWVFGGEAAVSSKAAAQAMTFLR
jgi:hypothetical protein